MDMSRHPSAPAEPATPRERPGAPRERPGTPRERIVAALRQRAEAGAAPAEASASAGAQAAASLPALIEGLADAPLPGQWTEFDRPRRVVFLEALATGGSVRSAARAADISQQTAYRARRADPAFRIAWSGALLAARVHAEATLETRAIDGIEEKVFYRGEEVATRRRYSDRLLLAHIGRLDKLTEDARAHAVAEDFEAALARFAAGEDPLAPAAPAATPEPEKTSSGQCNIRSKSNSPEAGEPELQPCPVTGKMLPHDEWLRNVMESERPAGAKKPHEFRTPHSTAMIEYEQLSAFEERVDRWWLVMPPGPGDDPGEWCYYQEP